MATEEKVLEQVRRLLAKANSTSSEPEREALLKQASLKMARHAIDQAMLDANRTVGEKRKPVSKVISFFDAESLWAPYFYTLIHDLAITNRCRVAIHAGYTSMTIVGMQEDVDWVEILWLQVFLEFSAKINPKWDLNLSVQENIFTFKQAGYKWVDIWNLGNRTIPGGMPDFNAVFIPNKCKYMITGYKKLCAERGITPVGTQTFAAYKLTFTNYFAYALSQRLEQMRADAAGEAAETDGSTVALYDVSLLIDQLFYDLFPSLNPEEQARRKEELARSRKRQEEEDARYLASLSPAARKRVLDERAAEERRQAAANSKYYRSSSRRSYDAAGAQAGDHAAQSVNLTRTGKAAEAATTRQEIAR